MQVRIGNGTVEPHVALALFGFFGEDVTLECFLVHDLPGAGHFEAFFGTGVCFYFRHGTQYLIVTLEVFPHRQDPY